MDNTWRMSTPTILSKQPPHLGMKKLLRRFFCEQSLEDPLGEHLDQFYEQAMVENQVDERKEEQT
jgi:hypothetical protein